MKENLFYFYLLKFRLNSVFLQNLSYKYLTLFKSNLNSWSSRSSSKGKFKKIHQNFSETLILLQIYDPSLFFISKKKGGEARLPFLQPGSSLFD